MADLAEMVNLAWEHTKAQGKMIAGYAMKVWEVLAERFMKGCKSIVCALFEVESSKVHVKEDKWVLIFFHGFSFSLVTLTCLLSQCSSVWERLHLHVLYFCCHIVLSVYYEKTFWLLKPEHGFDFEPLIRTSHLHSEQLEFLTDTLRAITSDFDRETGTWQSVLRMFPTSISLLIPKEHMW